MLSSFIAGMVIKAIPVFYEAYFQRTSIKSIPVQKSVNSRHKLLTIKILRKKTGD